MNKSNQYMRIVNRAIPYILFMALGFVIGTHFQIGYFFGDEPIVEFNEPIIIKEVRQYRSRQNSPADEDVSAIVRKYIKEGDDIYQVIENLQLMGFSVNEISNKKHFDPMKYDTAFAANWHIYERKKIFRDKLKIYIHVKEGLVKKVTSQVVLLAP